MRHLTLVAPVLVALFSMTPTGHTAHAQTVDCSNNANHTQFEMNVCAQRDYREADDALNAAWQYAYQKADRSINPPLLLSAQRAWISYRDNQCDAEANRYQGGTIQPLIRASCLARMTRARTKELLSFAPEY